MSQKNCAKFPHNTRSRIGVYYQRKLDTKWFQFGAMMRREVIPLGRKQESGELIVVSEKQKLVMSIVTEGGQVRGFGHITRCLAIGHVFEENGFVLRCFILGDDSVRSLFPNHQQPEIMDWQESPELLLEGISDSALVLVDSSLISDAQLKDVEASGIPVVFIDDELRRNVLDSGFVVDWTVLSERTEHFFPRKSTVSYLLGSSYTPLRREFCDAQPITVDSQVRRVMVTQGGADVRNLTGVIVSTLSENFPELKKDVIVGAGFGNVTALKQLVKNDPMVRLIEHADAPTMIRTMQHCDLAVASGGQTLYELARLGVPTLAILLVDNAVDDTEGWSDVGALYNLGWYNEPGLLPALIAGVQALYCQEVRLQMHHAGIEMIGHDGAKRLYRGIVSRLQRVSEGPVGAIP